MPISSISNVQTLDPAAQNAARAGRPTSAQGMQDQFLKLLIAQLQNQDPSNPMDNSQMTSQMAQISTVSGLEKLNDTVGSITGQFASMQLMQGASMIGRSVLTPGNTLAVAEGNSQASAAFDLPAASTSTTVTITTAAGEVVDTLDLGPATAGRNYFTWDTSKYPGQASNLRFHVAAASGDAALVPTPLAASRVMATNITDGALTLDLGNGRTIRYSDVRTMF